MLRETQWAGKFVQANQKFLMKSYLGYPFKKDVFRVGILAAFFDG